MTKIGTEAACGDTMRIRMWMEIEFFVKIPIRTCCSNRFRLSFRIRFPSICTKWDIRWQYGNKWEEHPDNNLEHSVKYAVYSLIAYRTASHVWIPHLFRSIRFICNLWVFGIDIFMNVIIKLKTGTLLHSASEHNINNATRLRNDWLHVQLYKHLCIWCAAVRCSPRHRVNLD